MKKLMNLDKMFISQNIPAKMNQPCIQVCEKGLDIEGVDRCTNNPSIVAKTERMEPNDYTPISSEDVHHL